jgi:LPXTG-motif cell wall-anchored protein
MVKVADLISSMSESVKVSAMNIKNPNQTVIVYSNPKTGEYEFQLPQGDYQITYEGDGGERVVKNIDLPLQNPSDSFALPGTILPKTDFVADLNVETNKTISVTKGDSILFPMKVEPKSTLIVEHWVGDSLVSTERFAILDSTFNYKMAPSRGNNRLVFKLTDRFNNTTKTEVLITRENKVIEQPVVKPEYSRIISEKQIASLATVIKNRATDNLLNVINEAKPEKQQFGKVDDYITYLKAEAAKKGIAPDEVDKLALKVAVMDNILTQAAVDYLAKHTTGDLSKIFTGLNIYDANLKNWTELQEYISSKTGGKITPTDMNAIADAVLTDKDPAIVIIKKKIVAFSTTSPYQEIIRQALLAVDEGNFKTKEDWLKAFYEEAMKRGMTQGQITEMLALVTSLPGTDAEKYLGDLINHSDESLATALKAIDLKKEGIKTPEELLSFLFRNKDKYSESQLDKSIADLIESKEIPQQNAIAKNTSLMKNNLWIVLVAIVALLLSLFLIFRKRKRKNEN